MWHSCVCVCGIHVLGVWYSCVCACASASETHSFCVCLRGEARGSARLSDTEECSTEAAASLCVRVRGCAS